MTHDEAKVLQNVLETLMADFCERTGAHVNEVWQLVSQYANAKWEDER